MKCHFFLLDFPAAMGAALVGVEDILTLANRFSDEASFLSERVCVGNYPTLSENVNILFLPPCMTPFSDTIKPEGLTDYLNEWQQRNAIIVACCASVFWLAETGLLDDKMATTHWRLFEPLSRQFPKIKAIEKQDVVVDEGSVITAAGLFAYQDLILHLIAKFTGFDIAKEVADFAMLEISPRLQSHYQHFQPNYHHGDPLVLKAQQFCDTSDIKKLTVKRLCKHMSMTERTLMRRFKQVLHLSPSQYILQTRIEQSKQALSLSLQSIEQIAYQLGYNDVSNFSRAFKLVTGITPANYRSRGF
ncbi:GlxA family transcriptional regulator [Marinomonas sp. 2405UD66-6]|uniref:GlxA family transcriptional regulator n=1 Tax=Marinomonas sp. 2405UD66-6 TaxID=3391834 RepID=UPI0039C9388F